MLDRYQTVASLVLDHSACAEVLQRHRIDFCCGGDATLEEAASERGLDVDTLLAELAAVVARGTRPVEARQLATPELIEHIVKVHHEYLRGSLPFIAHLAAKVARVHGDRAPNLHQLDAAVEELQDALLPHLDEEESALFPSLLRGRAAPESLEAMQDEHRHVAELLARARAASGDYVLPPFACTSYRTLFAELQRLESDVFTHVHLENHVLRPRFAAGAP